jgi:methylaspartate ammonia-lyase
VGENMMEDKELQCQCEENEVEQVNLEDLSKEELIQVIEQLSNPMVDMDAVCGTPVDTDEFDKGVVKASYYAGIFQTLVSAGMSADNAYEVVLNEHTSLYNKELAKLNNDTQIEISKNTAIQMDKNSI